MNNPDIPQKKPYVMQVEAGNYFYCTCGKSTRQPYCDGSHKGSEFRPMKVEIEEPKTVAWCGCKHSAGKPFCDGNHAKL